MSIPAHCSAATLAKLLSLSEWRIHQLANQGLIPKVKCGQYDTVDGIHATLDYLHPNHAYQH